jgi:serpin B
MTRIARLLGAILVSGLAAGAADRNAFSESLYRHAARHGGNVVLSPYNISAALSMVLAGARGDTAAEMRQVLGEPVIDEISKTGNTNGNEFLAANSVWVQRGFSILPEFSKTALPVDFQDDVEAARAEINSWTDRQTRGKIKDLFAPGSIRSDTRLVLASAVYFNGKWEQAFRRTDTKPEEFTPSSGRPEQVPFMHRTGRFGYAETAAGQTLEMRYAGTGLAFDILLPKKGAPLETAEKAMTGWLGGLKDQSVQVSVPKFRVSWEAQLRSALEAIGIRKAFTGAADFSGIDDRSDLRLSQVVHKAWIDVTEEGTEAAAATGATMALVSMRMSSQPVFRADRPFVFLIRDTRSGLILFAGRVVDPKR